MNEKGFYCWLLKASFCKPCASPTARPHMELIWGYPMLMGTVVGAFPLQQVAMVFLELVPILSHSSSCVVVHGAPLTSLGRQSSKFRPSDYPNTTYSAFLGQKRKLHPLQQPPFFLLQNVCHSLDMDLDQRRFTAVAPKTSYRFS